MPSFSALDGVPSLGSWQFAYTIDDGHSAGTIVRATITQKTESANAEAQAVAVLKCVIAVIDSQNNVQTDAAGDAMDTVYVTTKTLTTDAGQAVSVADEAADLVSNCIVEVANRLAVHSSIASMAIPSG
ncbi:hypothetical protein ACJJIE_03925 [Microbulbifer sp. TRSA001]|uniref:hypothetical protein n=1 Tax=unclassified Microbulbifer TaxID=2619833 RepID=UPI0024AE3EAF|nr:hypothetical protein [Microbulbifer sp. VAAF005]WHI46603.1 hypothetical protein P0078_23330 [Microbulbifer sp. VAAF005]